MKRLTLLLSILLSSSSLAQAPVPKNGYVPTEKAAIAIAKTILSSMQGDLAVKQQEPFHAELRDDVWEVYGKWQAHPDLHQRGGGGLDMRINKQTGEILGYYFMR